MKLEFTKLTLTTVVVYWNKSLCFSVWMVKLTWQLHGFGAFVKFSLFLPVYKIQLEMREIQEEEKIPFIPLEAYSDLTSTCWQSRISTSIFSSITRPIFPWLLVVFILLCNIAVYTITHSASHEVSWTPTDFGK